MRIATKTPTPSYLESIKKVEGIGDLSSKVWIIGESPGAEEVIKGEPFVGASGDKLKSILNQYGINNYYLDNLCAYRPTKNNFSSLLVTTGKGKTKQTSWVPELSDSLTELHKKILTHKPKVILALGANPLFFLTGQVGAITSLRGSIYPYQFDNSITVLGTFHPSYVLRAPENYPAFDHDIQKVRQLELGTFKLPELCIDISPSQETVDLYSQASFLSVDIESVKGSAQIICVGFARSKTDAISIHLDGSALRNYQVRQLLESPSAKIMHNGVFDTAMLEYNGYTVTNYIHDTIVAAHTLYLEMPKDLEFLTSMHTNLNYYKAEGKKTIPTDQKGWSGQRLKRDLPSLMTYNCKDVIATYWIWEEFMKDLEADANDMRIYKYEMILTRELLKLSHFGLLRDPKRTAILKTAIETELERFNTGLTMALGGVKFNAGSHTQVKHILYEHFKLPKRYKFNPKTRKYELTSDNDALVYLLTHAKDKGLMLEAFFVFTLIQYREADKRLTSQINVTPSRDGRIKSLYRVHGTETGRLAANKYVDNTGMNSQTITRDSVEVTDAG